ncbi:MAG TPA: GTPase Era [Dermatophilaceae bacterium]|nr:GTPase Era [Dermatophilaceae bacterium]
MTQEFRAGFACLVGRPNAGKSTLTNALVGQKVAITSSKPQTTRHTIRGIVTSSTGQLILVDTPGLHKPRTLLGQRLNDLVRETLLEVDAIGFCLPADQRIGPGDTYIARELTELQLAKRRPVLAIATKSDRVDKQRLAEHLIAIDQLGDWSAIIPCSAVRGDQVTEVAAVLSSYLPVSPMLYPDGVLTDEPEIIMIAELVREAALEGLEDEMPHSLAVVVEEMLPRERRPESSPMLDVRVNVFVERSSQKAIIIGKGGSRLREVGTNARQGIEALLGQRIYLDLHVKVAKDWQRDPKQLQRLGF